MPANKLLLMSIVDSSLPVNIAFPDLCRATSLSAKQLPEVWQLRRAIGTEQWLQRSLTNVPDKARNCIATSWLATCVLLNSILICLQN